MFLNYTVHTCFKILPAIFLRAWENITRMKLNCKKKEWKCYRVKLESKILLFALLMNKNFTLQSEEVVFLLEKGEGLLLDWFTMFMLKHSTQSDIYLCKWQNASWEIVHCPFTGKKNTIGLQKNSITSFTNLLVVGLFR